jgi:hypothetical protein
VVVVREFVSRCSRLTVKVKTDSSGDAYSPNRSSIFYCGLSRIRPLRRAFYEQVAGVKVCASLFRYRAFVVVVPRLVAPHVALHRVSMRTLDELSWCKLGAGWGSRGESMLPFLVRP